ncbi:elongation factor G [Platysternon megacephalum]|uniref:Elongation factor G n=1 Tax=Platysternon megacephalum TaxID=55544 RepID=A0A4D9DK22_9SAUR|nr:elongation factor G [Platysternon megacephalum]
MKANRVFPAVDAPLLGLIPGQETDTQGEVRAFTGPTLAGGREEPTGGGARCQGMCSERHSQGPGHRPLSTRSYRERPTVTAAVRTACYRCDSPHWEHAEALVHLTLQPVTGTSYSREPHSLRAGAAVGAPQCPGAAPNQHRDLPSLYGVSYSNVTPVLSGTGPARGGCGWLDSPAARATPHPRVTITSSGCVWSLSSPGSGGGRAVRTHPDEAGLERSRGGGRQQGAEPEPTSDWDEGLGPNSPLAAPRVNRQGRHWEEGGWAQRGLAA